MAKNITRHLSHLKSSGGTAPAAADLLYGEIAVGYLKDNEALYIKNSTGEVVTFTTAAGSQALAELYTDQHVISNVVGDSEINVDLSDVADSGRTLTVTHALGSEQSGFKKLSSDTYGHITAGTDVELSDLVTLGALSAVTGENGISASTAANGNQKIGHTNSITAGSAKTSSTSVTATISGNDIEIPSIEYDAQGHIKTTGVTNVSIKVDSATTGTAGVVKIATTTGNNNSDVVMTQSAVTQVIEENERVVAEALNDLNSRICAFTESTVTGSDGLTGGGPISGDVVIKHVTAFTAGSQTSPNTAQAPSFGDTFNVPVVSYDKYGHITATTTTTVQVPASASTWNDNYYISGATVTTGASRVDVALSGNNAAAKASFIIPSATTSTAGVVRIATTTGNNNTNVVMTQSAVTKAIDDSFAAQDAMRYKGVLASSSDLTSLTDYSIGDTYKVSAPFTVDGVSLEIGDMVIAEHSGATYSQGNFNFIQANLDPTQYVLTSRTITTTSGITGGGDLSSNLTLGLVATGTSGTYAKVVTDAYGRVTSGSATIEESDVTNLVDDLASKVNSGITVTGSNGLTGGGALSGNVVISHASAFTAGSQTSPNAAQTPSFGDTFNVPVVSYDKYGHITATTTTTVQVPASASTWNDNYYISGATVTTAASKVDVALSGNNTAAKASFTIPSATTTAAGVMTSEDKVKLNSMHSGATKVAFSQTNTSGDEIGKITIDDGTPISLYADNHSLSVVGGTNSTEAVSYTPSADKTLTVSGSDSSIGVSGSTNTLTIGLGDIICGDYA